MPQTKPFSTVPRKLYTPKIYHRATVILKSILILYFRNSLCQPEDETCVPPTINNAIVPHEFCKVFKRICFYQNALVSFDSNYFASYDSVTNRSELRQPLPYLPTWTSSWNIPGAINSDAIVGNQDAYKLTLRPATRFEALPNLQQTPVFSRCTLPAVLLADWPFNYGEFFINGASTADLMFRRQRVVLGRDVTLALALPAGLGLMKFHQALLGHLSIRPVMTLEQMAADAAATAHSGGGSGHVARVSWSHDGLPRSCFEQVLVCKLQGTHESSQLATAAAVATHLDANGGPLPYDPLRYAAAEATVLGGDSRGTNVSDVSSGISDSDGADANVKVNLNAHWPPRLPPLGGDSTLRVAVDARRGAVRNIRNLHQIIEACERAEWKEVGGFRRVVCRPLVTYDTPQLSGLDRVRATIAAVRSSHVLIAVHGAGATNAFFLQPDDGTATALLEIRPCGFGSGFPWWVDVHMAIHLPRLGDEVRLHAYNIEDATQCSPSDYELDIRNTSKGPTNTRAGGGHFIRDQHLTIRPDGLMAMLRHVASMLRDPVSYMAAKAANRLHGYALPGEMLAPGDGRGMEGNGGVGASDGHGKVMGLWGRSGGVVLGPLGLGNFSEYAASGTAEFVLQPG